MSLITEGNGVSSVSVKDSIGGKRPVRENLLVLFFYSLMTVSVTYPVIAHLLDKVMGSYPEDNLHFVWELWYPAHAIFDLHKSPFFDPDVYFPYGFSLIRNQDLSPATVLLFMPLTRLIGEIGTYNVLMLGSFVLTAFGTYLLARELWGSRAGALIAGLIVGFCPYRFTHAGGHLSIGSTQWIPFFFLYLERMLSKPTTRSAVLAGVFFALSALVTWYYFFLLPIAAVFYIAFRLRWWSDRQRLHKLLKPAFVAVGVSMVFILPFLVPYFLATHGAVVDYRGPGESQAFSASLADFIIPPGPHPLWGSWVARHWRSGPNGLWMSEWQLYLGVVAMVLAVIGVCHRRRKVVLAILAMSIICLVFALGPGIYITHPPPLNSTTNDVPLSPIPAPGKWLRELPGFNNLRGWSRFGFFVQLGVGLLAGGGLAVLLNRVNNCDRATMRRRQWAVTTIVAGLVALDFVEKPFGVSDASPRPVDAWLARQPGKFPIMEYPVPKNGYGGRAIYSTRLTGKQIVLGDAQAPPNFASWELLSVFPSAETLDLLARWQVKYVLVDETLYGTGSEFWGLTQTWESLEPAMLASGRLKQVTVLDGVHVYALLDSAVQTAGKELAMNCGFEEAAASGRPTHWLALGNPVFDVSGIKSREGAGAICVSPRDYFVSDAVNVEGGRCYLLQVSTRAQQPESLARLQINWINAAGEPLSSSPVTLRVITTSLTWERAQFNFVAPQGAASCQIYAVAQAGRVWLDEYSFKKNVDNCPANFLAVPNPVPLLKPEGRAAIVWDTHCATPGQIYLAVDGGTETLFAKGANGLQVLSGIHAGSRYEFRLYLDSDRRGPIERLQVSAQRSSGQLQISEVLFPANSTRGSATVTWHSTDRSPGRIYVSKDSGAEVLFAQGSDGAQNVTWIVAGSRYQFRLYTASSGSFPAATVTIPAIKK
jgi:hypothetical protein